MREGCRETGADGKCHRKQTTVRFAGGKGEKAVQETTGPSRERGRKVNPIRSKIK